MTEVALSQVDNLLLEWLQSARVGRTEKQSLLLDGILNSRHTASPETTQTALAVLESVSASSTDITYLRHQAEALTVSADVPFIASRLAPDCAMELRLGDTTQVFVGADAAGAIATELCEQQQSLLDIQCRASAPGSDRRGSTHALNRVRSASSPTSWLVDPSTPFAARSSSSQARYTVSSDAAEPYECGPLRVGTLVTYYDDCDHRRVVFSVHTVFCFAADGQHVENIVRTMQSRDGSSAVEALADVHFGYLLEKNLTSAAL